MRNEMEVVKAARLMGSRLLLKFEPIVANARLGFCIRSDREISPTPTGCVYVVMPPMVSPGPIPISPSPVKNEIIPDPVDPRIRISP